MLSLLIFLPLVCCFIMLFVSTKNIRFFSIILSFCIFLYMFQLISNFNLTSTSFQYIEIYDWCPLYNLKFILGIDGISLCLIVLTSFLIFICLLSSQNISIYYKEYVILFFIMEFFLFVVFSSLDLLMFYIFFESILIPMFIIIGVWGSRTRKIRANYLFFIYTLFGSVFMLVGIIYIYTLVGTTDYLYLLTYTFTLKQQKFLWLSFFLSFAIKVPMVPFHIWLPEAHVEAPTAGSVILAGILLKLGTYGFIRFSIPLFPDASIFYTPLIYSLSLVGIIYASLIAIRQVDLKKIIAYASVAHMNLVILGLFSTNVYGLCGSVLQMITHGLAASALFLCVGVLYDRYHTRLISYYGGLVYTMPLFSFYFLFFILANIAIPGSGNFISEFMILIGLMHNNIIICILAASGIILSVIYSLWLYNRVVFGTIKINYISKTLDLNIYEIVIFSMLGLLILILGLYPQVLIKYIEISVNLLI